MNKLLQHVVGIGAVMAGAVSAHAAPSLVNGGFELGDFSGWTLAQDLGLNQVDTGSQHGGDYSAFFGETGVPASLAQSLSTEVGHSYTVTFWLANLGGSAGNLDTHNRFQMLLDGTAHISVDDKSATDYTQYHYDFVAASSATSLAFSFQHDENFWLLDDVAVAELPGPVPAVPEPSTALMLLLGLGALTLQRRLR